MNTQSNGMHVLVAAADAGFGGMLARGLLQQNVDVAIERSVPEARERVLAETFDAVIVDSVLPGGGGAELCRALRRLGATVPTIMLIDVDSIADRVRARGSDADAYLPKPVSISTLLSELQARKASRPVEAAASRLTAGDLVIDLWSRGVVRRGRRFDLTPKEFALLEILARRPGTIVDRDTIVEHVWRDERPGTANVLEVLVRRLRQKIDDGDTRELIQTHRGKGYRLVVPVVSDAAPASPTAHV